MDVPAIRTTGLGRSFGSVQALDDVSLEIPQGAVFGLLGPNGAGKTTMIRILLGLVDPTSGRAEVFGYDTRSSGTAIRQHTGALLEHCGLYERLSAEDNLELYGRIWRMPRDARRARVRELLDGLRLWERRREPVATWSRGMKQRLAIARALFNRPALVFLDEPTAGLDPIAAKTLREDLARLAASENVTVFVTTHNLAEAARLCTLVGVIRSGHLVAVGSPAEVSSSAGSLEDAFVALVEGEES